MRGVPPKNRKAKPRMDLCRGGMRPDCEVWEEKGDSTGRKTWEEKKQQGGRRLSSFKKRIDGTHGFWRVGKDRTTFAG